MIHLDPAGSTLLQGSERGADCVSAAWPRYRVLRSLDIGQYNLEISNAQLSDDSLYECQATEAALRSRRAKLNVLSKSQRRGPRGEGERAQLIVTERLASRKPKESDVAAVSSSTLDLI